VSMVHKRAIGVSLLALAIGTGSSGAAFAAGTGSAAQSANVSYVVNGVSVNLSTISENGQTLAALRDISPKLGAKLSVSGGAIQAKLNNHVVTLKNGSDVLLADGTERKLPVPVKSIKGVTYVDLKTYVEALGAQFAKDASGPIWIDAALPENVDHIQWVDATRFIASSETETGRKDELVDSLTGKSQRLLVPEDASELVVAPNGAKAAYTNANGEVFVLDFKAVGPVRASGDTSIKTELVWSADSAAIYFLQGDKGSVIAKLEPEINKISKVLEDKVDYKANLQVSADGKTFTYTVTKPGAVVADANKPVEADDVTIDMKGTEPQIYQFTVDPTAKESKAVQLTTSADDKVFIRASEDGSSVSYVSVSPEDGAKSVLAKVGKDKKTSTLFDDKDVYEAVAAGGKWFLLTEGDGDGLAVYEIDNATGAAKPVYALKDTVSEIYAKEGSPFAVLNDGRVFLDFEGHWRPISR